MSISIVNSPSKSEFYNLVKSSSNELLLCAPFLKKDIIDDILSLKQHNAKLQVITSSKIKSFVDGVLDVEAIEELLKAGVPVMSYQDLHAKVYFFDSKRALITSANLTNKALTKNYEYGVLINEDEKAAIDKIYEDFIGMLSSKFCLEFNKEDIEYIKKTVKDYKATHKVVVSKTTDSDILEIRRHQVLSNNLNSWQKDVFLVLDKMKNQVVTLNEIYGFEKELSKLHPNNKHVKEKIRQILQQLAKKGLVEFTKKGIYRKLWY